MKQVKQLTCIIEREVVSRLLTVVSSLNLQERNIIDFLAESVSAVVLVVFLPLFCPLNSSELPPLASVLRDERNRSQTSMRRSPLQD